MKLAVVNAVKSHLNHLVNKKLVDNGLVDNLIHFSTSKLNVSFHEIYTILYVFFLDTGWFIRFY